jgi:hypothetical protein
MIITVGTYKYTNDHDNKQALHTKEQLLLTENHTIHDNDNQEEEDYNTWQLPTLKSEPEILQDKHNCDDT